MFRKMLCIILLTGCFVLGYSTSQLMLEYNKAHVLALEIATDNLNRIIENYNFYKDMLDSNEYTYEVECDILEQMNAIAKYYSDTYNNYSKVFGYIDMPEELQYN